MGKQRGLPQDTEVTRCWLCRSWHQPGDWRCPVGWWHRLTHWLDGITERMVWRFAIVAAVLFFYVLMRAFIEWAAEFLY